LSSEDFEQGGPADILREFDGLLIPGGFGMRGVEGMTDAVKYAREQALPFFGICLGLQVAVVEFARNMCNLEDAHSSEVENELDQAVICLMDSQRNITDMGGTMRLGAYPARLRPGSKAHAAYGVLEISERHRHRYEVNNVYRDILAEKGMKFSGVSPDGNLVEIIEVPDHPYFLGCQFHPELKSRPMRPHPLFTAFIAAAKRRAHPEKEKGEGAETNGAQHSAVSAVDR
jgi:CTP synthase